MKVGEGENERRERERREDTREILYSSFATPGAWLRQAAQYEYSLIIVVTIAGAA